MKHITKVRELYEETIHWISESEDSWKNFLSCMGRFFYLEENLEKKEGEKSHVS